MELRLRRDMPVSVLADGKYFFLGEGGASKNPSGGIIINGKDIEDIVFRCSGYSVYSVNNSLAQGFITISGGVRVGICGECVCDGSGKITTIKNFSSLVVRFPHQVTGCSDILFNEVYKDKLFNTLIVSPPGGGKTTMLRDIARNISVRQGKNVLIADERNEISASGYFACGAGSASAFDLGQTCDIITFCNKGQAFSMALRCYRPDVIITDELASEDIKYIQETARCGVKVFASIHAENFEDLKSRENLKEIIDKKIFEVIIVLSNESVGEIREIYSPLEGWTRSGRGGSCL